MVLTKLTAAALIAAALQLAGCGGGGDSGSSSPAPAPAPAPTVLIDTNTMVTGGSDIMQASAVTFLVDGPQFVLAEEKTVRICATTTWTQRVRQPVQLTLAYTMTAPVQGGPTSTSSAQAPAVGDHQVVVQQCETYTFGASTRRLQARLRLDTNCGCASALSGYTADIAWRVTTI